MPTVTTTRKLSVEQFADYAASHDHCELIDGEVWPMSPTNFKRGIVTLRLATAIQNFITKHDLGVALTGEPGFVTNPDPNNPSVRAPDVAYFHKDRAPSPDTDTFADVPPDLCIEVLSPSDRAGAVAAKVEMWLNWGVRRVWVVDPATRSITEYEPGGAAQVYHADQMFCGGDVLPGFELRVNELFV